MKQRLGRRLKNKILHILLNDYINTSVGGLREEIEQLKYVYMCREEMERNDMQPHRLVKVHFINMMSEGNVGDYNCGPFQYFAPYFKNYKCYFYNILNIKWNQIQKNDWIIFGGVDC